MVISSSTAQDKEIEGFDNRSGRPFRRRRVLEGRLAARELGVSKQGQGRIGTKARPIGKLPEAVADRLGTVWRCSTAKPAATKSLITTARLGNSAATSRAPGKKRNRVGKPSRRSPNVPRIKTRP